MHIDFNPSSDLRASSPMYCWFGVQYCIPQWISISWEAIGASTTCPSSKEQPRSPPPGRNVAASSRRGTAALRSWAGSMDSSSIARLPPKLSTSEIPASGMYAFCFTLTSWSLTNIREYIWAKETLANCSFLARNHEWASSNQQEAITISRRHVLTPQSSTSPQTHPPLASSAVLRTDRRWWPFTDAGAAAAAAAGEHRAETGITNVKFDNCIGSSSRPLVMSPAVSGDRRLPFRWRHGGSGRDVISYQGPGSSSKITARSSSDPIVIDDGQQVEVPYVRAHLYAAFFTHCALGSPRSVISDSALYARSIISAAEFEARRRTNKGLRRSSWRGVPQAAAVAGGGPARCHAGPTAQLVPFLGFGQEEKDSVVVVFHGHKLRVLDLSLAVATRRCSFHAAAAAARKDKTKQRQQRRRWRRSWAEYFGSDHVDQGIGVRSFKYFGPARPSKTCTLRHAINIVNLTSYLSQYIDIYHMWMSWLVIVSRKTTAASLYIFGPYICKHGHICSFVTASLGNKTPARLHNNFNRYVRSGSCYYAFAWVFESA